MGLRSGLGLTLVLGLGSCTVMVNVKNLGGKWGLKLGWELGWKSRVETGVGNWGGKLWYKTGVRTSNHL